MNRAEIVDLLHRTFRAGVLQRLPKRQAHADIFMALSVVALDPEAFFDETEINLHLSAFLNGIASQFDFILTKPFSYFFATSRCFCTKPSLKIGSVNKAFLF